MQVPSALQDTSNGLTTKPLVGRPGTVCVPQCCPSQLSDRPGQMLPEKKKPTALQNVRLVHESPMRVASSPVMAGAIVPDPAIPGTSPARRVCAATAGPAGRARRAVAYPVLAASRPPAAPAAGAAAAIASSATPANAGAMRMDERFLVMAGHHSGVCRHVAEHRQPRRASPPNQYLGRLGSFNRFRT